MKCENCEVEHDGNYGSGRFCCTKCARGFSTKEKRKEINQKVSKKLKGIPTGRITGTRKPKILENNKITPITKIRNYEQWVNKNKQIWEDKKQNRLQTEQFEMLPVAWRIEIVYNEQNTKCNSCGLSKWLGQSITLELEHKDGNNKNNIRENLELLCPNCHSLTDTWRGRNKKITKRISDKDMLNALNTTHTIRQALLSLGISAKGNNYLRAKKLLNM